MWSPCTGSAGRISGTLVVVFVARKCGTKRGKGDEGDGIVVGVAVIDSLICILVIYWIMMRRSMNGIS